MVRKASKKKAARPGSAEWRKKVRKLFLYLSKAAKEDRLVLVEGVADDGSKKGQTVAIIAEELIVDEERGKLHPLGLIMDDTLWLVVSQPKGVYKIFNQDGTAVKVAQAPDEPAE